MAGLEMYAHMEDKKVKTFQRKIISSLKLYQRENSFTVASNEKSKKERNTNYF